MIRPRSRDGRLAISVTAAVVIVIAGGPYAVDDVLYRAGWLAGFICGAVALFAAWAIHE